MKKYKEQLVNSQRHRTVNSPYIVNQRLDEDEVKERVRLLELKKQKQRKLNELLESMNGIPKDAANSKQLLNHVKKSC